MTRANRERKKKKRIDIAKCMYDLPMFDSHFEPVVRLTTMQRETLFPRLRCLFTV